MDYNGDTVKEWAGNSQWRAWRADLARFRKHGYSGWGSEGFWALMIYRIQRGLGKRRPRVLWLPARVVMAVVKKLFTTVTHINLCHQAEIGPGMLIPHVGPIQVFPFAKIGADCAIHQVCTIGAGSRPGGPEIGDHVMIGCHTCTAGDEGGLPGGDRLGQRLDRQVPTGRRGQGDGEERLWGVPPPPFEPGVGESGQWRVGSG